MIDCWGSYGILIHLELCFIFLFSLPVLPSYSPPVPIHKLLFFFQKDISHALMSNFLINENLQIDIFI